MLPELCCQSYAARVILPELYCQSYTARVILPELYCPEESTRYSRYKTLSADMLT